MCPAQTGLLNIRDPPRIRGYYAIIAALAATISTPAADNQTE